MNTTIKKLPMCAAVAALAVAASAPAQALVMTQPAQSFAADEDLVFNLFDASLGTLTGVAFTIESRWETSLDLDFDGAEGAGGQITAESSHAAIFDSGVDTNGIRDLGNLGPVGCSFRRDFAARYNIVCDKSDSSSGVITGDVATLFAIAFNPANFIGVGAFDVSLAATATELVCSSELGSGDPSCTATTSWLADGTASNGLSLTYTYDAPASGVPEPSTLAVMFIGLTGLGAVGRRNRRDKTAS